MRVIEQLVGLSYNAYSFRCFFTTTKYYEKQNASEPRLMKIA